MRPRDLKRPLGSMSYEEAVDTAAEALEYALNFERDVLPDNTMMRYAQALHVIDKKKRGRRGRV